MAEYKKSIADKIIAGVLLVGAGVLFYLGYAVNIDWINNNKILIVFSSILLVFYELLSFAWDSKFHKIEKSIIGKQDDGEKTTIKSAKDEMCDKFQNLAKHNTDVLSNRDKQYTNEMLSETECNLKTALSVDENNEYVIIYIITNDNDVEIEEFGDVIRENILKDIQYKYMTNLPNDVFHSRLRRKIFKNGEENFNYLLNAAYAKNIQHISKKEFFYHKPDYSDIVIYAKYTHNDIRQNREKFLGFYCYQNGAIDEPFKVGDYASDIKHYYYYKMPEETQMAKKIIDDYFKNEEFWDSVCHSWCSKKIELKSSNINGEGLFAKEQINKGEEIFKMGGYFEPLTVTRKEGNTYLQINGQVCLCGTDTEDKNVKFCANHSCTPNCGLKDEITFVALKKIHEGEEILVDYATLGNKYCLAFDCNNQQCDKHSDCSHKINESNKHKNGIESDLPFQKKQKNKKQNNN